MEIKYENKVVIQGNCTNFTRDRYSIELSSKCMLLGTYDADSDEEVNVVLTPEDSIKIANEILNYYENALLK